MNDSRIVFINYIPGSFGSFLLKCLSATPNVFLRTTDSNFFDELGASHYNIPHYLENFHDRKDIEDWLRLNDDEKSILIDKSWNPPEQFVHSNMYYIHRLLVPLKTKEIKSYFPNAKFIKINVPDKYIITVLRMYESKRTPVLKGKELGKVIWPYVTKNRNNDIIDGVYNFDISHLMENTFLEEFDRLCEWLNFEKTDVSELYEKFKQLNGITNEE
jgi:hypothetical protein